MSSSRLAEEDGRQLGHTSELKEHTHLHSFAPGNLLELTGWQRYLLYLEWEVCWIEMKQRIELICYYM